MSKEIAVFLDTSGQTISFNEAGIVKVYAKKNDEWDVVKEYKFSLDNDMNLKLMRESITVVVETIEPCKVIVAKTVTGIPYNILEKNGYNIWEIEGEPKDFLDYVLAKEEVEESSKLGPNEQRETMPEKPIETDKDGCYYIDFKKLQEVNKNITSKKALLPFLRNKTFYELEIIFSHIPPWFDNEIKSLNMQSEILMLSANQYKVTVWNKICGE